MDGDGHTDLIVGMSGGDDVVSYDFFADAVASAGDVNGDGLSDIVIGAPSAHADDAAAGAVYVFLGRERAPRAWRWPGAHVARIMRNCWEPRCV